MTLSTKLRHGFIMLLSLALTAFIFVSSYEITSSKDLPYIGTIGSVELGPVLQGIK